MQKQADLMNKISDLKVGDQVVTSRFGKAKIESIGIKMLLLTDIENMPLYKNCHFYKWEIDWQKTNELNNKQMKEFIIECPSGFEVDKEKSTFEKIVFKEIDELNDNLIK